jgi:hypothetical protein
LETRLLSPVTSKYVDEEAQRRFGWFKRAVEQDLFQQGQTWTEPWDSACETLYKAYSQWLINGDFPGRCGISRNKPWFIVPFIRGCGQWRWDWNLESMKGMRAVGDPSSLLLVPRQLYVVLKKTLELEDDADGNRWRAHEYTTLVPSDDGSHKLIAAVTITQLLLSIPSLAANILGHVTFNNLIFSYLINLLDPFLADLTSR